MKAYDLMVGSVYTFDGGLFVMENFDWELELYPHICIASRNPKYLLGSCYPMNGDAEIKLISSQVLKTDFIPKDVDYEMD